MARAIWRLMFAVWNTMAQLRGQAIAGKLSSDVRRRVLGDAGQDVRPGSSAA